MRWLIKLVVGQYYVTWDCPDWPFDEARASAIQSIESFLTPSPRT